MAAVLVVGRGAHRHAWVQHLRVGGHTVREVPQLQDGLQGCSHAESPYTTIVVTPDVEVTPEALTTARATWPQATFLILGHDTQNVVAYPFDGRDRAAGEAHNPRRSVQIPGGRFQHDLIAIDPATRAVFSKADQVAAVDSPVLITGETGTGKEVLARRIHAVGPRRRGTFVPVNCACLPETLLETELFGYRKGAFTGAVANTGGLIDEAEGGTLFLDEIGDMPLSLQVRLLRFLDSGEVRRVGDRTIRHANVRIIAATNCSLEEEVNRKRFRRDLFFRLNVMPLHIPPLRQRRGDISALLEVHLRSAAAMFGHPAPIVSDEALRILLEHDWPGNIRELHNVVEQTMLQARDAVVQVHDLPANVRKARKPRANHVVDADDQREMLATLLRHNGKRLETAAALGISRTTLWRRLAFGGVDPAPPKQLESEACSGRADG